MTNGSFAGLEGPSSEPIGWAPIDDTSGIGPSVDEKARMRAPSYDAGYFATALGEPYRPNNPRWLEFFGSVADAIVRELAPRTVLDAGCAMGFLVAALRDRGVEASGVDISDYAISQVRDDIRPYCSVGSVTEELSKKYDLVVCIEVLEHLPDDAAQRAIDNFAGHTDAVLFSSTPSDFREATHVNVREPSYWAGLFARHGFYRDVDLDATFVARHAVLFRKGRGPFSSVIRAYERRHWQATQEIHELRAANVAAREEDGRLRSELDAARDELVRARAALAAALQGKTGELVRRDAVPAGPDLTSSQPGSGPLIARSLAWLSRRSPLAGRRAASELHRSGAAPQPSTGALSPSLASSESNRSNSVLFVSGSGGDAQRYRCDHQAEQLRAIGWRADVAFNREIDLKATGRQYGHVVLHRVLWSQDVEHLVEDIRARGGLVVYDTDDLVFDPAVGPRLAIFGRMTEKQQSLHLAAMLAQRSTLRRADVVLVSTEPLRVAAAPLNEHVRVLTNVAGRRMVEVADAALAEKGVHGHTEPASTGRVTLGYISGTPTHERDILEAAASILWALATYPYVRLLLAGPIELDERFAAFQDRVVRVPLQPWESLPRLLADVEVNLAPLERESPFAAAKSCVKYIEAGLMAVPTIASPVWDFERSIVSGFNGFLARDEDQWKDALRRLIESPSLRERVGLTAAERVRSHHITGVTPPILHQVLTRAPAVSVGWASSTLR